MLQYNTSYQCHYKDYEKNKELVETEEFKIFTEEDKYYLEKKIYQDDLLSIFCFEKEEVFIDEKVNIIIHDLYLKLSNYEKMKLLMQKINKSDPEMGLMIMFSMDFLYLAHPCFCEFLEKGCVSSENFTLLEKEIKKNCLL
jgi:hypothetical protein